MSSTRHGAIALETFPLEQGERFEPHSHDEHHQLAWVRSGVLMVTIDARNWVLPSNLALWVPAGVLHTTTAVRSATLQGIYIEALPSIHAYQTPTVVAMTPLAREFIDHLAGSLAPDARARAEAVLPDLLTPVDTITIEVPMPLDSRAAAIAHALVSDPSDARDLDTWGHSVGASTRTLSRLFAAETGLGFTQWRTQVRLRAALGRLADGQSVSQAAWGVGYSSASAFIASFRRVTGQTPGEYFHQVDDSARVDR